MENNQARALTYQALVELKSTLDQAESPEDFLAHAESIVGRPENQLALPINLGGPERLNTAPGSGQDMDNAPLVYEYLGALDRANASDRRLWTFLAFSTYRDYMEKRWPLYEGRNWKSRVETRWMMGGPNRRRLTRHGIARLWWISSLTHDPKRQHLLSQTSGDPFAYTREVFRNEDRINSLFEREAGAIPDLVRSVLEHVAQGGPHARDEHVRALMEEITLVYGYRDISYLDRDNLRSLIATSAPTVAPAE